MKYLELLLPQVFEIRKFLEDERISNRKEREGHGELRVFLKNFEDDADAGETQGWRASLEGFW